METDTLQAAIDRMLGGGAAVERLARLSGGANMESWSFDRAGHGYVLRRAPTAAMMAGRAFGHDVEAALVRLTRERGVRAPEIVGELTAADGLGSGYLMRRVAAEVRPDRILAAPPPSLLDDLAHELALIHAIPPADAPALPLARAVDMVAALRARFLGYGGDRPVMALALRWLETHLPAEVLPVILHGDFRIGNLMVDDHGLAAVLDWELAHLGDRHQDLAFGCIDSWRFDWPAREAFGVGTIGDFFAAYERASGTVVDRAAFRFWLIYSTLWWGLCCLEMAEIWRSGRDRAVERLVVARRASETEIDLLLLLEDDAPAAERRRIDLTPPPRDVSRGEPSVSELLGAVETWLTDTIKPTLQGRARFEANVALNALRITARGTPGGFDAALSAELLAGDVDLRAPGLLARLRGESFARCAADQPKYWGLRTARERWGH